MVYRILEDNLNDNENNYLSTEPPTDKPLAVVSEKFDIESEDIFNIVRQLLARKDTGRGSSIYLLYSNEADSDASSETHESSSNIKLCELKTLKLEVRQVNRYS